MKLRIDFKTENDYLIYDNKYFISSWIYGCLNKADPVLAENMHSSKNIKYFTFSNLFFKNASFDKEKIILSGNKVTLYISFWNKSFGENVIKGLIDTPLVLGPNVLRAINIRKMVIDNFDKSLSNEFHYCSLSPVCVSKSNFKGVEIYYCNPSEFCFYDGIKNNLLKKYKKLFQKEYLGNLIIEPVKSEKIYPKLYSVKSGKISSYEMDFRIKCSPRMRMVILSCGLGEKNSLGFGMVDIIRSKVR